MLQALERGVAKGQWVIASRERAIADIGAAIPSDEPFAILDEEELRYDLAATHARVIAFRERDGFFDGLPADDDGALAELDRLRAAGVSKLVLWRNDFWALDYYPSLRDHLSSRCAELLRTPEVRIYGLNNAP